jgi:hypothetical protein
MARIIKVISVDELPTKKGVHLIGKVGIELSRAMPQATVYNLFPAVPRPGAVREARVKLREAFIIGDVHSNMISGDYPTPLRYNGVSLMSATQDGGDLFILFTWIYNNFAVFVSHKEGQYRPDNIEYTLNLFAREFISADFLPKKFNNLIRSY